MLRGGDEKSLAINPHGIADDDGSLASGYSLQFGHWKEEEDGKDISGSE